MVRDTSKKDPKSDGNIEKSHSRLQVRLSRQNMLDVFGFLCIESLEGQGPHSMLVFPKVNESPPRPTSTLHTGSRVHGSLNTPEMDISGHVDP